MNPVWLPKSAILAMYEELLAEFGGSSSNVDIGLLEATLARAQQKLAYDDDIDLFDLAASYGFDFARNHCFTDGNKRISLVSIDVFLQLNDHELIAEEIHAVATINSLAAGDLSEAELAEWIRRNSSTYKPTQDK